MKGQNKRKQTLQISPQQSLRRRKGHTWKVSRFSVLTTKESMSHMPRNDDWSMPWSIQAWLSWPNLIWNKMLLGSPKARPSHNCSTSSSSRLVWKNYRWAPTSSAVKAHRRSSPHCSIPAASIPLRHSILRVHASFLPTTCAPSLPPSLTRQRNLKCATFGSNLEIERSRRSWNQPRQAILARSRS